MQVVVDSLMTQYERAGAGRPVLVLHGWGDNSKSWRGFQKLLGDEYEVVAVDLPGFGGTQAPKQPWGLSDYAAYVGHFCKKIRLNPYAIIGHSNGGAIAIRGLARKDLRAERLVLLDSAGIRNEYKGRTRALRALTKTGKFLSAPLPKSVKRNLRRTVYKSVGSDMLVVEHLQETFKRVVTDDVQGDAATLHLPTLLICGEDDLATPVQYGRILHNLISRSELKVGPSAGHFVHIDKPETVVRDIRRFLA
jgi:pimeloyl-ACP methyl ester carboxylesterase